MHRTQEETTVAARLTILKAFTEMKREQLDLHVFFEPAGNNPADRGRVLDAIDARESSSLVGEIFTL